MCGTIIGPDELGLHGVIREQETNDLLVYFHGSQWHRLRWLEDHQS